MKQRGFSLVMAIFLIVVLGGIAVLVGRVSTMQYRSSALDEEGAMAYQAARTGIEWGVYQAIQNTSCAALSQFTLPLTVPMTATTPQGTVNYTVAVACALTAGTEGATAFNVYQITATAANAGDGNYRVERRLTATVSR